jgi:hypothetical protein
MEYAKDLYREIAFDSHMVAFTITPKNIVLASVFLTSADSEIPADEKADLTIRLLKSLAVATAYIGNKQTALL